MTSTGKAEFLSWEGLEEREWQEIHRHIRRIEELDAEIKAKEQARRSSKALRKELSEVTAQHQRIGREWGARPFPSSASRPPSMSNKTTRSIRALYRIACEGLVNPNIARDDSFLARLLHEKERLMGTTGSQTKEENAQDAEEFDEEKEDREDMEQVYAEGMHSEILQRQDSNEHAAEAALAEFSPPPEFWEVEKEDEAQLDEEPAVKYSQFKLDETEPDVDLSMLQSRISKFAL